MTTDVKHRKACTKLAYYMGMRDKSTVLTEHLIEHYGTRRYVDVATVISGTRSSINDEDSWLYMEVKHDLSFDVGEELRKAADVKHMHYTRRGSERAEYILVLPEGPDTLDWVEQNAWYLFGSQIDFVAGFNPDDPLIYEDKPLGTYGGGMSDLLTMSKTVMKQSAWSSDRLVIDRYSRQEAQQALSELRGRVLASYPGRFERASHSPTTG